MAAYFVAFAKIKDASKLAQYAAAAGPTIGAAGGSVVGRGKLAGCLTGHLDIDSGLIAKFPSAAAVRAWYDSPTYQALIPLRDEAMNATFLILDEPPAA